MTRTHNESGPRLTTVAKPSALSNNEAELALIRRVSLRDRAALRELYLLYHRRLSRFLMRLTQRQDVAEEVINDTLLVVWNSADRFRGDSRVSTWIVGIAYRRALKSVRRRRSFELLELEATDSLVGVDGVQACETQEWIEEALEELPVEQRMCLELAYVLGHSCEEISVITSCPVNTVKTRLYHARRKLSTLLPLLAGNPPNTPQNNNQSP
ncbi:RNA polymerase sigma factor [Peristeroidobacter agariperforans]|uniref:RNA polymerase sigma factor n=1 Tax=Peristeroidobacter agariperforans TaxID=268404 RepID=UPI00101D3CD5|nr:sigma-70 family RNA polymerase sigma factor [Peristeroidobacter agariperforans]